LYAKGYSKKKIHSILGFILYYVNFENPEYPAIFGQAINTINQAESAMGVIELIQEELKRQAREEGLKEGREEGREEGIEYAVVGLLRNGFSPQQIAEMLSLSLDKVMAIKTKLDAGEIEGQ
jgi:predicted transposase/invertase (TIGR01784 family)